VPLIRRACGWLIALSLAWLAPGCGESKRETPLPEAGGKASAGAAGAGGAKAGDGAQPSTGGDLGAAGVVAVGTAGTVSAGGSSTVGGTTSAAGSVNEAGEGGASGQPSGGGGHAVGGAGAGHGGSAGAGGVTSGGAGSAGGSAMGGNAGTGCTGSFETVQTDGKHLCVAKMVTIEGPDAGSSYQIDATEVTIGQYDVWLGTYPALPLDTDATCGWKSTGSYSETGRGNTGTDPGHHPVANVDWCDARAYCAGVGKRLCGAIGGGPGDYSSYTDAAESQWYRACSSGGRHKYPYGDVLQAGLCNDGKPASADATTTVGSLPDCTSSLDGYSGVYDMDGNVAEWEDSCSDGSCHVRGSAFGYYLTDENDQSCVGSGASYANQASSNQSAPTLGFRCCSL
jgi:sulfatase modifying factor 1